MAIDVCTTFQTLGNLAAMTKRKSSLSPSNSMLVPLQTLTPRYSSRRQLAVLHPIASTSTTNRRFSRFKLPDGWAVEEVPRSDATRVDRYYFEPGTGNKFRSLRAVERYINGEECTPQSRSMMLHNFEHPRYSKMIIYGGKLMRLDGEDFNQGQLAIVASADAFFITKNAIPDGWVIEEVPRRNSHHTDKYYYEPETGRKFRSQVGVLRHITQLREDMPLAAALEEIKENKPLSKAFKCHRGKNSISGKKMFTKNNMQSSSFVNPPKKIKWVLASPKGDAWKPFIFETPVPDSVKQQWNQRFKSSMGDEGHNQQCCGAPRYFDALKALFLSVDGDILLATIPQRNVMEENEFTLLVQPGRQCSIKCL